MDGRTVGRMDGYSLVKINMKQIYKVRYYVDLSWQQSGEVFHWNRPNKPSFYNNALLD